MALPDNRIRLPAAKIDFDTDVGTAGQDHDDYPPPQGQARFDHMRSFLVGLLAQQSSFDEPSQYRDGTPWFDLNHFTLKIRHDGDWVPLANVLAVAQVDDEVTTLADWYASVAEALGSLAPEITFSGTCTADSITLIDIPTSLQAYLHADSRPIVYINGALIDPRNTALEGTTSVRLTNLTLDSGDDFTVFIRRIPSSTFHTPTVSVP